MSGKSFITRSPPTSVVQESTLHICIIRDGPSLFLLLPIRPPPVTTYPSCLVRQRVSVLLREHVASLKCAYDEVEGSDLSLGVLRGGGGEEGGGGGGDRGEEEERG